MSIDFSREGRQKISVERSQKDACQGGRATRVRATSSFGFVIGRIGSGNAVDIGGVPVPASDQTRLDLATSGRG